MATYATYRHVELDKVGQGKKRVLKPPGGGSSISFGDDDPKVDSQCSPRSSTASSTVQSPSPTAVSPGNEADSPKVMNQNHNESNGMVLGSKVSDQKDSSTSHTFLQNNTIIAHGKGIEAENCDSRSNVSSVHCEPNKLAAENSTTSVVTLKDLSESVNGISNISIANSKVSPGTENDVHPVNKICVNAENERDTKMILSNGVNKNETITQAPITNGVSKSPDVLKVEVYHTSSVASPLFALSPASPSMRPNEDTRDRVIGYSDSNGNTTPQSVQQRKIKDHMRSSIFMCDEDYTPTRSSRVNATINDTTPEELPCAGQRQRVPPGGFSSKLW